MTADPAREFPAATPARDVAVAGWGDAAGYHLQVATGSSGFGWREVAVLRPLGTDDSNWYGYQCVSGDGRYAAVTVLPAGALNVAAARDHGAVAYSVNLASGKARPVVAGVGLKYHSPGCGTGSTAVFTANPGENQRSTVIVTADLVAGAVTARATVSGQVTSVVPAESGVVGAMGQRLVRIPIKGATAGRPVALLTTAGPAYQLRSAADGGVDFVTSGDKSIAYAWHERAGRSSRLASGPSDRLRLFQGRAGRSVVSGADTVAAGSVTVRVDDTPLPHGAQFSSLDGSALFGADADATKSEPTVLASGTQRLVTRDRAPNGNEKVTVALPTSTSTGAAVAPAIAAKNAKAATSVVAQTPKCAVPRLDPTRQSLQPNAAQVDWAVQMAAQNLLTGSLGRPANYANMGLAAYAPNTDFAKIPLQHPASESWDTVPRSIMEAIMAQESNWSQASWHALPGIAGGPLIANYYGVIDSISAINYAKADCGYGVGQVTSGMAAADTQISPNGKVKVAVDYEENIAAGLQILQQKWNQLYTAGIIANDGSPRYLENWYFAAWAYNTGVQPSAQFGNTTGCTPGPACVGPDGTWGLGWSNNPRNPDYPPGRPNYLRNTYGDAAHPSDWAYQERILGWAGRALIRMNAPAYATPTYHGGRTWLNLPDITAFCTADNKCNNADPAAKYCTLASFQCWWHTPVTWAACATVCATSSYALGAGSTEPALINPHPPTCGLDTKKVPNAGYGAPVIVDDLPNPTNLVGCGTSNWSNNGTFTYAYGTNAAGDPIGSIDTHQLGAGFGGHILFTHTQSASNPDLINTGTWTPNLPKLQYYKIKLHLPATGATATSVVYTINPGGGARPWKIRVNQHWESEEWVTIGTFAMQNGGTVSLNNRSTDTATTDVDYSDFDVAFDAVAFIPMGGTPGKPIGGPPTVLDAPKGSNPAFVQCGCVRRTEGDPVDTSTGYFGQTVEDLTVPGRGMALNFSRTYNSALADPAGPNSAGAVNGAFGYGWTHTFDIAASTDATSGNVTIRQEDGSRVTFLAQGGGVFTTSAPRFDAALTVSGSTYTYTRRSKQIFTFEVATGRILSETDLAGAVANPPYATKLAYDATGHLSTVTDPAGRAFTLTWTGSHISGLRDSAGRTVTYGYDTAGNLTDVYGVGTTRSPALEDDDHMQFGYASGTHLMTSMRMPTAYGRTGTPTPVVSMVYDTAQRVKTQTDQIGRTTTFTYGPDTAAGLIAGQTKVTDPTGHTNLYTYTDGLLTSETHGAGTADTGTWSYTYDPVSLGVTTITDPNGALQTYSYDDHGNVTSGSDARGRTQSYAYNDNNQLTSTVDPRGVRTTYGWDEAKHIATAAGATNDGSQIFGMQTSTTVTPSTQTAEVSDGNPQTVVPRSESYYYDDPAHPADRSRTLDPRGNTTSRSFTTAGQVATSTDPEGNKSQFGYQTPTGTLTSVVSPTGTAAGTTTTCVPPAKGCQTFDYDAWGNVIRTVDPLGRSMSATFDADGNKLTSTDANQKTTKFTYDLADQPLAMTRADNTGTSMTYNPDGTVATTVNGNGRSTGYEYDGQGRRSSRTDPNSRKTAFHYDAAGNLKTVTDADNQVTTYGYSPSNELISVSYGDDTTPAVGYTYDAAGDLTVLTDGSGTSRWSYNSFGEAVAHTDGAGRTVSYEYDANGNRTAITYPGGPTQRVVQTFDKADRLSTVTDWNGRQSSFGYDKDANLKTTTYSNGTVVTNNYNDVDVLSGTVLTKGATTLAQLAYGRDNVQQMSSSTPTGLAGAAETFTYSDREQLGTVTSGGTATSYTFDAADNPVKLAGATQTFDPAGQLCWALASGAVASPACGTVPAGATRFGYNNRGDRLSATPATGTATTYKYDQADRLSSVGGPLGAATYAYDGTGLRVSKTVGSTTTRFSWDTGEVPALLADGTYSYVYGPDGAPIEQIGATATQWFLHDQIGSTRALLDSTGAITGQYTYTPFGTATRTGTAITALQYAGQYADAESGLVYLRARYYDPATAQFLTVDPLVEGTGAPYTYTANNPINGVDPSGEFAFFLPFIAAAVAVVEVVAVVLVVAVVVLAVAVAVDYVWQASKNRRGSSSGGSSSGNNGGGAEPAKPRRGTGQRIPPPSRLPAFPDAKPVRGKTSVQGGGGLRKRWVDSKGCIYEWDSQHGTVEKYSKDGKRHLGEYDPETGEQSKPPDKDRSVEK